MSQLQSALEKKRECLEDDIAQKIATEDFEAVENLQTKLLAAETEVRVLSRQITSLAAVLKDEKRHGQMLLDGVHRSFEHE